MVHAALSADSQGSGPQRHSRYGPYAASSVVLYNLNTEPFVPEAPQVLLDGFCGMIGIVAFCSKLPLSGQ